MNAKPAAAPAPHPFTLQLALGLVGVLIAASHDSPMPDDPLLRSLTVLDHRLS